MNAMSSSLKVAVVGGGRIMALHTRAIFATQGLTLAAVCDLNPDTAAARAEEFGVPGFTDMLEMQSQIAPDIVVIATDNSSHAKLTILAAKAGARAIHCEKPMAVHLPDAREMVSVCEATGTLLTINHQRRMGDVAMARQAIENGCIGAVLELHGYCAGDLLSDGTHLVDSLMALAGDPAVEKVLGALDVSEVNQRFGHPVEKGSTLMLDCGLGPFIRISTGSFANRRAYQEYHVIGSHGSLWRTGDIAKPNWFIADGKPGTHAAAFNNKTWFIKIEESNDGGPYRPMFAESNAGVDAEINVYQTIIAALRDGTPHPLAGKRTLAVQEIISAGYESGIRRAPVTIAEMQSIGRFPTSFEAAPISPPPQLVHS